MQARIEQHHKSRAARNEQKEQSGRKDEAKREEKMNRTTSKEL
jgi:hypothetical protein